MSEPMQRLRSWELELLRAETLGQWLECAVATPEGASASLLLADPTHELRPLLLGDRAASAAAPAAAVQCVASLTGLTPDLLAMRGAWRGAFQAADHALLFPGQANLRHVAILPLQRAGHLAGLYAAASGTVLPFDSLDAAWLDHAAGVVVATLDRHLDRARVLRGGLVDPLTGWNSPRYLAARLREELARAQRARGSVACLVADVDRLQAVNDALGYGAGDRALQEIAARIESEVRSSDAAARLGSDAFGIVLPAAAPAAVPLAERILASVRSAAVEAGDGLPRELSVSIGIAECRPQPGQDRKMLSDQLIADAVAAVYRAKQAGGDRYAFHAG